jgi:hypothetical protein
MLKRALKKPLLSRNPSTVFYALMMCHFAVYVECLHLAASPCTIPCLCTAASMPLSANNKPWVTEKGTDSAALKPNTPVASMWLGIGLCRHTSQWILGWLTHRWGVVISRLFWHHVVMGLSLFPPGRFTRTKHPHRKLRSKNKTKNRN